MRQGYWVILENIAGPIRSDFTETKDRIAVLVIQLATDGLEPGDVIRITEGESEQ